MERLRLIIAGSISLFMIFLFFSCGGGQEDIEPGLLKIVTERLPSAVFGQDYYFTLAGSGGYQPYKWEIAGALPEGIIFNPSSATFTGKPGPNAETKTFSIKLYDQISLKEQTPIVQKFTLSIQSGPFIASEKDLLPLRILTTSLTDGEVGSTYYTYISATGGLPPYKWQFSGSLPPGISFDSNSGLMSGTPTVNGKWKLFFKATDLLGKKVQAPSFVEFNIRPKALLRGEGLPPFRIISSNLPAAITGNQYSAFLSATGGISPYLWRIESPLPEGIEFDPESGELSGTPVTSGVFMLTFSAKDTNSITTSVRTTIKFEVLPPAVNRAFPLKLLTSTLPSAVTDQFYSVALSAQGGVMPYRWISLTPMPPGLTLKSETGLISGTPAERGTYTIKIELSDSRIPPSAAWRTFSFETISSSGSGWILWVLALGSICFASFITKIYLNLKKEKKQSAGNGILQIATDLLREAAEGTIYTSQVIVAGGTSPYTFEAISPLPQGFSLDSRKGIIAGKPPYSKPGKYEFKIKVTDSSTPPNDAVKFLTLEIFPGMVEIQKKVFTILAKEDKIFFETFPQGSGEKQLLNISDLDNESNPFNQLISQLRDENLKRDSFYVIYCYTAYPSGVDASIKASQIAHKKDIQFYNILKEKQ
jgi:hypothetical protein